jgi:hypothetical protein
MMRFWLSQNCSLIVWQPDLKSLIALNNGGDNGNKIVWQGGKSRQDNK